MNGYFKDSYLDGVFKYEHAFQIWCICSNMNKYTKFEFTKKYAIYFGLSFFTVRLFAVARDSAVGIAIRYGLNGPGIESRWGRGFSHLSRPAFWPTQPPVQWVSGLSRG
jgi:hypothetical protein